MTWLTREQILGAEDLKRQTVEVPEWGGTVQIQSLSGKQRGEWETATFRPDGQNVKVDVTASRALLVALSIVDADGKPLFTTKDVAALNNKSAAALERVYEAAQQISGLRKAEVDQAEKNSESAPSGASGSN